MSGGPSSRRAITRSPPRSWSICTRKDGKGRLRWKLQMFRHLYERGFERRDVELLFRFIDWLMALPEKLEEQFDVELRQLEGETKMPYVTRFERRAT